MHHDKEQPLTVFSVSPENICRFVVENYACYQGAWLCGKSSEILCYLLHMAGFKAEKVICKVDGCGHIFVRCNGLNLDPTIKQFGDYPEISASYPISRGFEITKMETYQ
nr:MAG: Transglutaminase-like domain [Bacteriophage sp.]